MVGVEPSDIVNKCQARKIEMKVVKDGGYEFELSTCDTGECVINYCKVKVQVQNKGGYPLNPVFYT